MRREIGAGDGNRTQAASVRFADRATNIGLPAIGVRKSTAPGQSDSMQDNTRGSWNAGTPDPPSEIAAHHQRTSRLLCHEAQGHSPAEVPPIGASAATGRVRPVSATARSVTRPDPRVVASRWTKRRSRRTIVARKARSGCAFGPALGRSIAPRAPPVGRFKWHVALQDVSASF
jgi:hypothetical protein